MARILISEPHDDVRRLLERMIARLGHEPFLVRAPTPAQLRSADILVVEPAAPAGAALTRAARAGLGVVFAANVVKPFTAAQLGAAVEQALCGEAQSA